MHRTRNSVTVIPADDGQYRAALFPLNILERPSIRCPSVSRAATELGSKMVAGRSSFVLGAH